ncbi:copper chaperone PCu(A)C [Temperatibacter marinus]|uniref:Copper chaperone PCu(A)C n=1 Tax=Temperatibacter marinus TaxID=1456591 RepID=A0AA52EJ14_9PROT|nr:copper chaperone PCu(A)C [Temperatibacter marinus]WND03409.1 copper chaperone PCu(A)C [Temperatibacter marinus]
MKFLITLMMLMSSFASMAHDGHKDSLEISNVWARETLGRTMSAAAYLTIKNIGHHDDHLVSVSSKIAAVTEIHLSKMENNMMMMAPVDGGLPLPKKKILRLKPQSYHIMMMRLTKPLAKGDVFPVTLTFKKAGDVEIFVEVRGIDGKK